MKLSPLRIRDKKGVEISTNTVIIAVIAILVLLVLALSFTGGMRALVDKIRQVFTGTVEPPIELARDKCNTLCTLQRVDSYCDGVDITVGGNRTEHFDCQSLYPCEGITC